MKTWTAACIVLILSADALFLRWVGVPWRVQLLGVGFFASLAGAGALCLCLRRAAFADRFAFWLAALSLGMALHMLLCFVAFHRGVWTALHLDGPRAALQVVFGIVSALGIAGFVRYARATRAADAAPACASPRAAAALFAIASIVAGATHLAFGNDPEIKVHGWDEAASGRGNWVVEEFIDTHRDPTFDPGHPRAPEWAGRIDSLWYVWFIPAWLSKHGLPEAFGQTTDAHDPKIGQFQHIGIELQLCGLLAIGAPFSVESAAAFSKPLALAWMFLLGAWLFLIGRDVVSLGDGAALLAAASGYLFSPINIGAPFVDEPFATHTLSYIATPIYWNMNQLAQLGVGLAGVYLVLTDLARPRRLYALGCCLIAASVYYKPSLYFVVAPALGLASLRLGRRFLRPDVLIGWAALIAAAVFWFGYPRWNDLPPLKSPIALGFLPMQTWYARGGVLPVRWNEALGSLPFKLIIVFAVIAAWILPLGVLVKDAFIRDPALRRRLLARPDIVMLVMLFLWGLFSAWCFVEDNERRMSNNYFFGGAVAYTTCLPLLVLGIRRIASRPLRAIAWLVFGAHVASGLFNLWVYVREGELT